MVRKYNPFKAVETHRVTDPSECHGETGTRAPVGYEVHICSRELWRMLDCGTPHLKTEHTNEKTHVKSHIYTVCCWSLYVVIFVDMALKLDKICPIFFIESNSRQETVLVPKHRLK